MKATKLFHVLVIAGGALAPTLLACSGSESPPTPSTAGTAQSGSTHGPTTVAGGKDKDGGGANTDTDASPPDDQGSGSHYW
jgi:hypothetical protein